MDHTKSLRKTKDFSKVYKEKKSKADQRLVLYIRKNNSPFNYLGISVSKKIGNSVVRHRIKRLIKESYRLSEKNFDQGYDFVFVVRKAARDASFHDISLSVCHLLKKMNV